MPSPVKLNWSPVNYHEVPLSELQPETGFICHFPAAYGRPATSVAGILLWQNASRARVYVEGEGETNWPTSCLVEPIDND